MMRGATAAASRASRSTGVAILARPGGHLSGISDIATQTRVSGAVLAIRAFPCDGGLIRSLNDLDVA